MSALEQAVRAHEDWDDEAIRVALIEADIVTLMLSTMHLEGDASILDGSVRPSLDFFADSVDGLSETERETVRERAFEALCRWRDAGCPPVEPLPDHVIERAMQFVTGKHLPEGQVPFLREEIALDPQGAHRPAWLDDEVGERRKRVAVIGGGMSGIATGVRLRRAGQPFAIFEAGETFGGTWNDNRYPGCRVDTPNHVYSYSFAPQRHWPAGFSTRETLHAYFAGVAEREGLREHTYFGTRVTAMRFDEARGSWTLTLRDADGKREEAFDVVISALGQLNVPKPPAIDGLETFAGPKFHSARWEHEHDLTAKRVAVIGTGASATQFVPAIADEVAQLTILQRSPPWLVPTPDYHHAVPDGARWLFENVPFYAEWYRFVLFCRDGAPGPLPLLYVEEGWSKEGSVGAGNARLRELWTDYLREQAGGDEALLARIVPDYPPGGKRPLRDNGSWIATLKRPDVDFVTDAIERVEPGGVRMRDGRLIEADVLIYGTGFQADRFFAGIDVEGLDGATMREREDDPRAYRGISVPGFPNLFVLYGPNTNTVVGPGIVFYSECAMRYVMGCLNWMERDGLKAIDVREAPFEAYNEWIDDLNGRRAWGAAGVSSWYKNAKGRVTQNWPDTPYAYWRMTLAPEPEHYRTL